MASLVEKKDEDEDIEQSDDRVSDIKYGGALWDIFRRQDVPKLTEYIKKHQREFRSINNSPVRSLIHTNCKSATKLIYLMVKVKLRIDPLL